MWQGMTTREKRNYLGGSGTDSSKDTVSHAGSSAATNSRKKNAGVEDFHHGGGRLSLFVSWNSTRNNLALKNARIYFCEGKIS